VLSTLQTPSPLPPSTSAGPWLAVRRAVWPAVAGVLALPSHAAGQPVAAGPDPLLQGFFLGASLVPLLYGLALWARLKDARSAGYTAAVLATVAYYTALASAGERPAVQPGPLAWALPLLHLLAACAACFYVASEAQRSSSNARRVRALQACAALAAGGAAWVVAGALNADMAHALACVLGVAPLAWALPGTSRQRRASDPEGHWSLRRGGPFTLSMLMLSAALQGATALAGLNLPLAQFLSLAALTAGLLVLGERLKRSSAEAAAAPGRRSQTQAAAGPHIDTLTGALNSEGLHAAAHSRLTQCTPQRPVAVLHAELDGFGAVSKTLGVQAGDAVLAAAAERLRAHLRGTDLVCRLDGARFAVVLGPLSPDFEKDARFIAAKLQKAFEPPFRAGDTLCCVGLKLGSAFAPQHHTSLDPLIESARAHTRTGGGLPTRVPSLQLSG
jgi:diguanylate cyclase (GGDEF)-like protein